MSDFYYPKTSENQSLTISETKSERISSKDTQLLSGDGLLSDTLEVSTWADFSQPSKYGVVQSYVDFYTAPRYYFPVHNKPTDMKFESWSLYCIAAMIKNFIDKVFHCSVILYIHAPVHIYGVTYYSATTTSDVVVAYNTSGPWNLMLSGHANY